MLLHAFPSMFVSSFREFSENCVYKHVVLNCLIEYLHRKWFTAYFLSYVIESSKKKKVHLLDLYIQTINFLFYNYVFNILAKMMKNVGTNQLFPLLKYVINIS
jgi:hypothetical protein